jgi:ssDNA-binding protein
MSQPQNLVMLNNVRSVFPKFFEGQAEAFEGKGDPYYSGSFLLELTDPQIELVKAEQRRVVQAKHPTDWEERLKVYAMKDKLALHDGAMKAGKSYGAAYKGKLYVSGRNNAKTNPPIPVYDSEIDPATNEARVIKSIADKRAPYSGCFVNVYLNFFAYNAGGGEGVGASIAGVQFHADGERLSGGIIAKASNFVAVPAAAKAVVAATGKGAASLF